MSFQRLFRPFSELLLLSIRAIRYYYVSEPLFIYPVARNFIIIIKKILVKTMQTIAAGLFNYSDLDSENGGPNNLGPTLRKRTFILLLASFPAAFVLVLALLTEHNRPAWEILVLLALPLFSALAPVSVALFPRFRILSVLGSLIVVSAVLNMESVCDKNLAPMLYDYF